MHAFFLSQKNPKWKMQVRREKLGKKRQLTHRSRRASETGEDGKSIMSEISTASKIATHQSRVLLNATKKILASITSIFATSSQLLAMSQ
jgi:hypothetical protein